MIDINLSVEETVAAIEEDLRAKGLIPKEPREPAPLRCEWCGVVEKYAGHVYGGTGDVLDGDFCDECWRGPVLELDRQLSREGQEERARRSKK